MISKTVKPEDEYEGILVDAPLDVYDGIELNGPHNHNTYCNKCGEKMYNHLIKATKRDLGDEHSVWTVDTYYCDKEKQFSSASPLVKELPQEEIIKRIYWLEKHLAKLTARLVELEVLTK